MKKILLFTLMVLFASSMFAQTTVWNPAANPIPDSLWSTAANWTEGAVPTLEDKVVFNVNPVVLCKVNSSTEAGRIVLGDGGPGLLTIKSGTTLTLGDLGWTSFAYNDTATLVVEADASITINHHNWMAMKDGALLDLQLYGSITSTQNIGLDRNSVGAIGNVTIYGGGLLSARYTDDANFGEGAKLDIQGGTFMFTQDELASVQLWISEGKIVAYGGEGMVKAVLVDGQTIVTSIPPGTTVWSPAEGGSGLWNDAANWSDKRVPLDTNRVLFYKANVQECVLDIETTVKRIAVGNGGDGGTLRIKSGGILNLIEDDSWSSIGQTHSGTLILETGAVINKAENRFDIGNQTGSNGTVTIDGGDLNIYDMNLGRTIGATGSLTINSGTITGGKSLDVADHGTGTLTMNGGEINIADDIYIAKSSDDATASMGTLTMNGGKIYMVEDMKAGNGGLGILTLNDGIIEIGDRLYLGEAGGTAELYIKGGELIVHDRINAIEDGSFIDITNGTIILDGEDQLESNSKITALIADGKIIAGGGTGTVNVEVADGQTILTAILPQRAETTVWAPLEGGDGLWSTNGNWSDLNVPDSNKVVFSNPDVPECVLDIESTIKQLSLGDGGVGGDTLRIAEGGTLNIIQDEWSAVGYNCSGTLIIETGGVLDKPLHRLDIGLTDGGNGTIIINGGTLKAVDMNWGKAATAIATVIVNSGTFETTEKSIDIAGDGSASLTVNGGEVIVADDIYLAKDDAAANGAITINGGKISMVEDMKAGDKGSGTVTINAGTIEIGDRLYLGEGGGTAEIYVKGGELIIHDKIDRIEGSSFIDISGGIIKLDGDQVGAINDYIAAEKIVAEGGEGTVKVEYDAEVNVTIITVGDAPEVNEILPVFPSVANNGPFPTGNEVKRSDSPFDNNSGLTTDIVFEYTAYKGTPAVDGNYDDDAWANIPWTEFQDSESRDGVDREYGFIHDPAFAPAFWGGPQDISAWFKIIHDADNVYVLTMRIDDDDDNSGTTAADPGGIWQNDIYQMILDSRAPGDYNTASPGAEVGFGHIGADETYNYWANGQQNEATELELADGNSTSVSPSSTGKAIKYKMHAGVTLGSTTQDLHVMEVAFKKYPGEFADESVGMFSMVAIDRDNGIQFETVLQFGQGIVAKDNELYASIKFSSEVITSTKELISDVSFELRNYPNPVGNMTHISYSLENNEHVTVNVYNISGRLVKTLVSEMQPSGTNIIDYDTSSLKNGVYLLNLRTGSRSVTTKFLK